MPEPKQAPLVKVLSANTRRCCRMGHRFLLSYAGQQVQETAALLWYLEDTEELLRDHSSLSVGRFLLFVAAIGAAAKLLLKHCTAPSTCP